MRFILVKCAAADDRFPDHVQWCAICSDRCITHYFWLRREDGEIGAKEFIRKRHPNATFSDE